MNAADSLLYRLPVYEQTIATSYNLSVNATLLKSIPLRSNDFRFEVEVVFKFAKRRARIFEAPIRYVPRTNAEGKKIRARDGLLALLAMMRFWLIDDLYKEDEYGSHILVELERTRRFNLWMGETLRPYIGDRVLEIGAGIGNLTNQFIPRVQLKLIDMLMPIIRRVDRLFPWSGVSLVAIAVKK